MATLFTFYKFLLYFSLLPAATEVSGIILDKFNNEPLANVYIYAVKGEEETLSNDKGGFKLLSWEALPLTVVFEKKGYKPVRVPVKKEQKNFKVILEAY